MLNELDAFDFMLALQLGKTLEEMKDMSHAEYLQWRAYFNYRQAVEGLHG